VTILYFGAFSNSTDFLTIFKSQIAKKTELFWFCMILVINYFKTKIFT